MRSADLGSDDWEECPGEAPEDARLSSLYGADFDLTVEPGLSYIVFDPAGGAPLQSALAGFGGAGTGPAQFLAGYMWADSPIPIGSDVWADTRVQLNGEILMNATSGSFTVPVAQGYTLEMFAVVDGDPKGYDIEPEESAVGHFDAENGWWDLDYSSENSAGSVEIHLEGLLFPTSGS